MLFGKGKEGQCVFGLPGNPVASLICLRKYVIEAFKDKLELNRRGQSYGVLTQDISFKKEFTLFKPVKVSYQNDGSISVTPVNGNGSGDFSSLAESDGFIELPAKINTFKKPEAYPLYFWEGKEL